MYVCLLPLQRLDSQILIVLVVYWPVCSCRERVESLSSNREKSLELDKETCYTTCEEREGRETRGGGRGGRERERGRERREGERE